MIPTREQAWEWLCEYNDSDSLRKHALTVEGVMRHFATLYPGEDPELWGIVGLLHDLDYEKYPDQHCTKTQEILREKGADEVIVRGTASHGYGLCCDIEPVSTMEKVLFTIDELSGLITAAALMRPSRSVMDMELGSLKKKYKDKRFAAGCSREVINQGAERLGWTLDELLEKTILAMRSCEAKVNEEMGL